MKIYISGKISDLPINEARHKFAGAAQFVSRIGHEAVNPMALPHKNLESWEECMALDIVALWECDAILMLHDWQASRGARLERSIMLMLNRPVFYSPDALRNTVTPRVIPFYPAAENRAENKTPRSWSPLWSILIFAVAAFLLRVFLGA